MLAENIQAERLKFTVDAPTISVSTLGILPVMAGRVLGAATSHFAGPSAHIKAINAIIKGKLTIMFQFDAAYNEANFFENFPFIFQERLKLSCCNTAAYFINARWVQSLP